MKGEKITQQFGFSVEESRDSVEKDDADSRQVEENDEELDELEEELEEENEDQALAAPLSEGGPDEAKQDDSLGEDNGDL